MLEDPELRAIDGAFYDEYAVNMRFLGTPVVGRGMFSAMKRHLGTKDLRLFLALRDAEVVGGLLCVVAPAGWTALYGVVRHALLTDYVNYLLYWHVIAASSRAGLSSLDLGGNSPGSGSQQFKTKWPGSERNVKHLYFARRGKDVPDFAKIHEGRSISQRVWKQLPLTVTNRLGPVLRAGIPFG